MRDDFGAAGTGTEGEARAGRAGPGPAGPGGPGRPPLCLAHLTDLQLTDVQSPTRFEFLNRYFADPRYAEIVPVQRPQEALAAHSAITRRSTRASVGRRPASGTLTNDRHPGPGGEPLLNGADVLALLHRFPNVVLWLNGHAHANTVRPRRDPADPSRGFWEVTTCAIADWPCPGAAGGAGRRRRAPVHRLHDGRPRHAAGPLVEGNR